MIGYFPREFNFFINLDFLRAAEFFLMIFLAAALSNNLIAALTVSAAFFSLASINFLESLTTSLIAFLTLKLRMARLVLLRNSLMADFLLGIIVD